MTTEIDPLPESSEARRRLRFLAGVLITGIANAFAVTVAENLSPSGALPFALMCVEAVVALFVIATTIEMARERSSGKLFVAGLAIMAAPFVALALRASMVSGGHDAATFGLIYFVWACVASGLSLLIVAGVRFVTEQRKQRSSARE
jgi:hypothetical protein